MQGGAWIGEAMKINNPPRERNPQQVGALVVSDEGEGFSYLTDSGEIGQTGIFRYCLGKTVYCNEPMAGRLETIFRQLPSETVKGIYSHKVSEWHVFRIRKERGSGWCIRVRRGKEQGYIINEPNLLSGCHTPTEITNRIERLQALFSESGFRATGDFRSTGDVAAQITPRHFALSYYNLPNEKHVKRFHNSYRGPRFQGVRFGKVKGHDYDLNTAYPSVLMQLPWFSRLHWFDNTNLMYAKHALYGAALCDIHLSEDLDYAPICVKWRGYLVSPVGRVRRAWLTLPEIQLFNDYPEIGKIIRVHHASWGYASKSYAHITPYAELVNRLYEMRQQTQEFGGYIKAVSNSFYGHFMQTYENNRAHSLYNPILAATITAQVRVDLFRRSIESGVFNEAVDGVAVDSELTVSEGLGGLKCDGEGEMTFFTPIFKDAAWHPLPDYMRDSTTNPDSLKLSGVQRLRTTIPYLAEIGAHHSQAGEWYVQQFDYPLGDVLRTGAELVSMGEVMDGEVRTYPPMLDELGRKLANLETMKAMGVLA